MRTARRILLSIPLVLTVTVIIYLNCALCYSPHFIKAGKDEINEDLLFQLRHLKKELASGTANDMQLQYPEGYFFMHVLYGLSWCEFAVSVSVDSPLYKEAQHETDRAYAALNTPEARQIFPEELPLPYGAFYNGWKNYLLAKKLFLLPAAERDSSEDARIFRGQCITIALAFENSETPFPESYSRQSWPADAMVCMASLASHDRLFEPRYEKLLRQWVEKVKKRLDADGMIPHKTDDATGKTLGSARGCSMSLMLNFLREIDPVFANEQFALYKKHFLASRFGLPGIREYPEGKPGGEYVDSGPVIFGIGGSASIVGMRTMALYGETTTATGLRNSIEAFGFPTESNGEKKYLFGAVPMADAFITWAGSEDAVPSQQMQTEENWRLRFQLYSLIVGVVCGWLFLRVWKITLNSLKTFRSNTP